MSEVLLRVADKTNVDDVYRDVQCLKRGDVVAVCPDGWGWAGEELTNPAWRILKLPNITEAQVATFMAPEIDSDPTIPSRMLRRRKYMLDPADAAIPAGVLAYLADDTRAAPSRTMNFTAAQFLALRRTKQALADPNVLG